MKKFCLLLAVLWGFLGKEVRAEMVDIPEDMWDYYLMTKPFSEIVKAQTQLVIVSTGLNDYENSSEIGQTLRDYAQQEANQSKFSYVKIPDEVFVRAGTSGPAFWFLGHCIGLCVVDIEKRTITEPEALDNFRNEDALAFLNNF